MKIRLKKRLLWGLLTAVLIFLPLSGCGERQQDAPAHTALSAEASIPAGIPASAEASVPVEMSAPEIFSPAAPPTEAQRVTVYVTKTGGKYHLSGCSHLAKSCIAIELETARQRYGPCSKCCPPT